VVVVVVLEELVMGTEVVMRLAVVERKEGV
jgi:hypothetical protein